MFRGGCIFCGSAAALLVEPPAMASAAAPNPAPRSSISRRDAPISAAAGIRLDTTFVSEFSDNAISCGFDVTPLHRRTGSGAASGIRRNSFQIGEYRPTLALGLSTTPKRLRVCKAIFVNRPDFSLRERLLPVQQTGSAPPLLRHTAPDRRFSTAFATARSACRRLQHRC